MAYKTIILRGQEYCPQETSKAGEAGIYPGMFLKFQADGDFEIQDESDTIGPLLIADVDTLQGHEIDDVYTSGDRMTARWVGIGAEFYGWLATGNSVDQASQCAFVGYEAPGCLGLAQQSSAQLGAGARFRPCETQNNTTGSAARCKFQRVC